MGKYTRTMAESLSMVSEVTNMDLMRKAAGGAMQTLKMKDGKVQMDSFTASAIMKIYDKVNDKNKKTMENMLKTGRRADIMKLQKFAMSKINAEYVPEELDEAKYDLYHKDFSSAMQHAYKMAKKLHGITIDPKEIDDKVATGPSKPGSGKTNKYRLKGDKGAIQVQVYNKGGSKPYELNMYQEEVDLDEGTWKVPETKIDQMALRKTLRKPIKAKDAEKVMSQHIGDDELYDEFAELEKDDPNQDVRPLIRNRMKELGIKEEVELGEAKYLEIDFKDKSTAEKAYNYINNEIWAGGNPPYDDFNQEGNSLQIDHNGDAKDLLDDLKDLPRNMKFKVAVNEARVDPADVDMDATEDDIKSADKNIMMQMRKVQSLRGNFAVEFMDGKKVKVDPKIAMAVQSKYMKMRRPAEKEKFQSKVAKSYRDMLSALKESLEEARQLKDPKKEMMVKSKDSGVIVIDKKDFKKYQKKGYFQVEDKGPLATVDEGKMSDLSLKIDDVVAKMKKDRQMKGFADKFKKDAMKSMDIEKSLEKVLPDYIAGKEIQKIMGEGFSSKESVLQRISQKIQERKNG